MLVGDNIHARRAMIPFAMQERSHFAYERGKRLLKTRLLSVRDAPAYPMSVNKILQDYRAGVKMPVCLVDLS
ncbi:hypothetical protein N7513_008133 [Penicillium frequentans]|nr:hypothetical protein N7513_008133 [Penicillium glabrum]